MNSTAGWVLGGTLAAALAISAAFAQQPTRIRGTIERVDGSTLTVRAGEAGELKLNLTDGAKVYGVVKAIARRHQAGGLCRRRRHAADRR